MVAVSRNRWRYLVEEQRAIAMIGARVLASISRPKTRRPWIVTCPAGTISRHQFKRAALLDCIGRNYRAIQMGLAVRYDVGFDRNELL